MNNQTIRVAGIVDGTSVDGPGLRTSIYVAGCRHRCPGCHNPGTWDFDAGEDMTVEALLDRIKDNGCNVTLSGGDPIYSASALIPLAQGVRELGRTLWCYSGFTFEDIEHMVGDAARLLD
ncbi:MAG: radical SAM protein, partial [Muribaculaceae bacterium]|nr:radical SAM protein [Muribaculaceae bacterium]